MKGSGKEEGAASVLAALVNKTAARIAMNLKTATAPREDGGARKKNRTAEKKVEREKKNREKGKRRPK